MAGRNVSEAANKQNAEEDKNAADDADIAALKEKDNLKAWVVDENVEETCHSPDGVSEAKDED